MLDDESLWGRLALPDDTIEHYLEYLSILDAFRTLLVNQRWRRFGEELDFLWRKLYQAEWESESGESEVITGGLALPWKCRLKERAQIERRWWRENGHQRVLTGHRSLINGLHLHGTRLVTASGDHTLRLWDTASGTCIHVLRGHHRFVDCVQLAGNLVISGSSDQSIKVWDAGTGECTLTLKGHTKGVICLQFDPVSGLLVSGSSDKSIRVWNLGSGECRAVLQAEAAVFSLQLDSHRVVCGSFDGCIREWHLPHADHKDSLKDDFKDKGRNKETAVNTKPFRQWRAHGYSVVECICLDASQNLLASSSTDQKIKLWDLHTARCLRTLQGHTDTVTCLQFAPRRSLLVSGSDDQTVRLWQLHTGRHRVLGEWHAVEEAEEEWTGFVRALQFDFHKLACGVGSQVHIWDFGTGSKADPAEFEAECRQELKQERSEHKGVLMQPPQPPQPPAAVEADSVNIDASATTTTKPNASTTATTNATTSTTTSTTTTTSTVPVTPEACARRRTRVVSLTTARVMSTMALTLARPPKRRRT